MNSFLRPRSLKVRVSNAFVADACASRFLFASPKESASHSNSGTPRRWKALSPKERVKLGPQEQDAIVERLTLRRRRVVERQSSVGARLERERQHVGSCEARVQ